MSAEAWHRGIVEGFYGRAWSWQKRRELAPFLARHGYDSHIYAPKSDAALRRLWREPFSSQWCDEIAGWADACGRAGLRWGLGISPLGLQDDWPAGRDQWRAKLAEIAALGPDILWCLFDDMPTQRDDLAGVQCAIAFELLDCGVQTLAACPGYYSDDPVLETVFGTRPPDYHADLGAGMPDAIDLLWTGPRVVSETLCPADLRDITQLWQRPPLLWDNYPVNDGRALVDYLHLAAPAGRAPGLTGAVRGHYLNPMNQAALSRLPLAGFGRAFDAEYCVEAVTEAMIREHADGCGELLLRDWRLFQRQGLSAIPAAQRQGLQREYQGCGGDMAAEVADWLDGGYAFDPDCLTG